MGTTHLSTRCCIPVPDVGWGPPVRVCRRAVLDPEAVGHWEASNRVLLLARKLGRVRPGIVQLGEPGVNNIDDTLPVLVLHRRVQGVCPTLPRDDPRGPSIVPDKVLDDCPPGLAPTGEWGCSIAVRVSSSTRDRECPSLVAPLCVGPRPRGDRQRVVVPPAGIVHPGVGPHEHAVHHLVQGVAFC